MPGPRVRPVALFCVLVGLLSACSTWVQQDTSPRAVLQQESEELVRVTLLNGSIVEVGNPRAQGDTLYALLPGSATPGTALKQYRVPLDSVQSVSLKQRSLSRTMSLVVGAPGLVVGGLFLMGF